MSVALYYNVNNRASDGELLWQLAGFADDGTFTLELPNGTNGTTIAYQIRITAPAAVMDAPVTVDDVTLGYGVYTKPSLKPSPKPSPRPTSRGTGGDSGHQGNDSSQTGTDTGNGSGTGAGNGNGAGNVSTVTFLADGRVVQEGPRGEVFNRPASEEVAEYLGVDVWLEGEIVEGPGDDLRFVLPGGAALSCAEGAPGPAFAVVHPEDVTLFRAEPDADAMSARNVVRAVVTEVRTRGRLRLVVLRWHDQPLQALVTRAAAEDLGLSTGDDVYAAIKAVAVQIVPRAARRSAAPPDEPGER